MCLKGKFRMIANNWNKLQWNFNQNRRRKTHPSYGDAVYFLIPQCVVCASLAGIPVSQEPSTSWYCGLTTLKFLAQCSWGCWHPQQLKAKNATKTPQRLPRNYKCQETLCTTWNICHHYRQILQGVGNEEGRNTRNLFQKFKNYIVKILARNCNYFSNFNQCFSLIPLNPHEGHSSMRK